MFDLLYQLTLSHNNLGTTRKRTDVYVRSSESSVTTSRFPRIYSTKTLKLKSNLRSVIFITPTTVNR